jgi:hypothetical protein
MEHKLTSKFLLWLRPDDKLTKEPHAKLRLSTSIFLNNGKKLGHLLMDLQMVE